MNIETMLNDPDYADLMNSFPSEDSVVDHSVYNNPNIRQVEEVKRNVSFNKPIVEQETRPQTQEAEYIIRRIYIDKMNEKCIRVKLTPSVCNICAFDVAEKIHGRWGLVPISERENVLGALAEHKRVYHTLGDQFIVKESQLPKQWLGSSF